MILRQFLHFDPVAASYLFGCVGKACCAVVDPIGDMGRTELSTSAEEGARAMFRSVKRHKAFPDYLEVLPGAFSGSVCGRSLSGKPTSTVGFERRFNKAFRITDEDEFVANMIADIPPAPPGAAATRAANSGKTAVLA